MSGTIIRGKYELGQLLGKGKFGSVYKATDLETGQTYAVKKMIADNHQNERELQFYKFLVKVTGKAPPECMPYIVCYFDAFLEGDYIYAILEYVEGQNLEEWRNNRQGLLTVDEMDNIISSTIRGIGYLHSNGVAHRDIKPENIMISNDGVVKIADFGLSCDRGKCKNQVGTPIYYSPQIINRETGYDNYVAGDLWSLGMTYYWLANNRQPFQVKTFAELRTAITGKNFKSTANYTPDDEVSRAWINSMIDVLLVSKVDVRASDEILNYLLDNREMYLLNDSYINKYQLVVMLNTVGYNVSLDTDQDELQRIIDRPLKCRIMNHEFSAEELRLLGKLFNVWDDEPLICSQLKGKFEDDYGGSIKIIRMAMFDTYLKGHLESRTLNNILKKFEHNAIDIDDYYLCDLETGYQLNTVDIILLGLTMFTDTPSYDLCSVIREMRYQPDIDMKFRYVIQDHIRKDINRAGLLLKLYDMILPDSGKESLSNVIIYQYNMAVNYEQHRTLYGMLEMVAPHKLHLLVKPTIDKIIYEIKASRQAAIDYYDLLLMINPAITNDEISSIYQALSINFYLKVNSGQIPQARIIEEIILAIDPNIISVSSLLKMLETAEKAIDEPNFAKYYPGDNRAKVEYIKDVINKLQGI